MKLGPLCAAGSSQYSTHDGGSLERQGAGVSHLGCAYGYLLQAGMVEQPCKSVFIHRHCVQIAACNAAWRLYMAPYLLQLHRLQIGRPQQLQTAWNLRSKFATSHQQWALRSRIRDAVWLLAVTMVAHWLTMSNNCSL